MEGYQLSTTAPRFTEEEVVASVGGSGSRVGQGSGQPPSFGPYIMGPYDLAAPLLPGGPTSHAHTFVTIDAARKYISGR